MVQKPQAFFEGLTSFVRLFCLEQGLALNDNRLLKRHRVHPGPFK